MPQKVAGFLVVPKKTNSAKRLGFDIWVTTGSRANPFFFTSAIARDAISRFPGYDSSRSTHLGEMDYLLHSDELILSLMGKKALERVNKWRVEHKLSGKPVYGYEFFPYQSQFEKNEFNRLVRDKKIFEKKGIALHAERIALRELLKVAPKAVLVPSLYMTDPRMNQLSRRGMKITGANQALSARQVLQVINQKLREVKSKTKFKSPQEKLADVLRTRKRLRQRR